MAVVERKSYQMTNRDATPKVINRPAAVAGGLKYAVGTVETVATDSINSVYRMVRVPSNAIMSSLRISTDDIGSSAAAADLGLYDTTANGGAVVDADFFEAAINLNAGALAGVEKLHGNAYTLEKAEKMLWEVLGLTSDPKKDYDICFTATGAIDAVATLVAKAQYATN